MLSLPSAGRVGPGPKPACDVLAFGRDRRYETRGANINCNTITEVLLMIIAIDGPAASGKGTLARRIAAHFNLAYLDTGSLYRAVARDVRHMNASLEDVALAARVARALDPASLNDPGLRDPGVGDAASIVAKFPEVRQALLDFQRDFARQEPGVVLDGRDIGTVVLPDADVKIFVVADLDVRARRRYNELVGRGEPVTYEGVLSVLKGRDDRDMSRTSSPMVAADDSHLLDTTNLDIEAAFDAAVDLITRKIGQQGRTPS